MRAFSWHPWIPGTRKLDFNLSLFKCAQYWSLLYLATVKELNRIKRKFGAMPNDNDLQGAALALDRLHYIYNFDIGDFTQGNIMGHHTPAKLDVKDTFYLGR